MAQQHRTYKQAQKESLYFQEVAVLFRQLVSDHPELQDMYPNRVTLSPDVGMCTIHFYSPKGEEFFKSKLKELILFKPSLRNAIAKRISQRRVPDFRFVWDTTAEKQQKIDALFDKIKIPSEESD